MRVLFLTPANRSHLYIATPLAWALRSAGHDVCVASRPDLAETIEQTGLIGVTCGPPDDATMTARMNEAEPEPPADPDGWRDPHQTDYAKDDRIGEYESLITNLYSVMSPDAMLDDLVTFARRWQPDLVIWDMLTYAGPLAARACGAAHARLTLATDGMGQLRTAFLAERTNPDYDPLREWFQPRLDRYDCGEFAEDLSLGQWTIDPMPSWTWHPDGVDYLPVRHVPFNGPALAPSWVYEERDRRRVCVTLGNSHRDAGRGEASAADLLSAVADLDVEVVATLDTRQLGETTLPGNVRAVDFVPLNELLPTCSALVHHGGAGTFAAAVEHAVPQLIVPSSWWSERWYGPIAMANGLQEHGAGRYISDSEHLTPERLRDGLVRVLSDPSFQTNAEQLRKETLEMPSPAAIVPDLERLTRRYRATSSRTGLAG
ncbi:activator-dependent family glycosyltransferase [Amycolatopsis sp. NPDC051716]|jgi:glycosyltransferase (activator-dependent family)|uniref:activator-dependent family glycosyltransferase n=1 Tax=Amycolatopsis sp. NPDC051716 TaxID=3155804 RepID=UPI003421BE63